MILGAVKLDVFPKAPHGEIAWLKGSLSCFLSHSDKLPKGKKKN